MMEIVFDKQFLDHEGGTKFYEVAVLRNHAAGKHVVIMRWGKMAARHGGGEVKIETFNSPGAALSAYNKKLEEKKKRGYYESPAKENLKFDSETLRLELGQRYSDLEVIDGVIHRLGLTDELSAVENDEDDIIVEEPKPEPVRSDDWASW